MSFEDAQKAAGREGKPTVHAKLPFSLKPREFYKGIPESTTWHVWWNPDTGIPELTLGVLDGSVIYKNVQYDEDGKRKGVAWALPEYQHK